MILLVFSSWVCDLLDIMKINLSKLKHSLCIKYIMVINYGFGILASQYCLTHSDLLIIQLFIQCLFHYISHSLIDIHSDSAIHYM